MSWESRKRLRRFLALLAAMLLAASVGCGIDDNDDDEDSGDGNSTAPDISGVYSGFFFSQETDEAIAIDQVVFIRTSDSSYQIDFDIDTEDGEDPTANALELVLNLSVVEGVVQSDGDIFIDAAQGLLTMNGKIQGGGSRIEGDWLLGIAAGGTVIEDSGSWEIFRRSR